MDNYFLNWFLLISLSTLTYLCFTLLFFLLLLLLCRGACIDQINVVEGWLCWERKEVICAAVVQNNCSSVAVLSCLFCNRATQKVFCFHQHIYPLITDRCMLSCVFEEESGSANIYAWRRTYEYDVFDVCNG